MRRTTRHYNRRGPAGHDSAPVRRDSVKLFEELVRDTKARIPDDLRAELPYLLWLYHMGITWKAYAEDIGWEYVRPDDGLALRDGESGLYFSGILEAQLARLNPGILNAENTADSLRRLNLLRPSIEGNGLVSWITDQEST